ncbi:cell division protein FtsZ, partial [Bacteroidota bacterium]
MDAFQFDLPTHHKSIIKVIGVGGGGSNAVNHMYNQGITGVEFIVCNTDAQALLSSPVTNKLQIGTHLTEGLGAGANPEIGADAALESKEEIRDMLSESTKMVFITAGMGGGTGTGAAPIIAKVAKELDILTVGIVTQPFRFEGNKKTEIAETGIKELQQCCDTVLVILNDKLREIYGNLPVTQAFAEADNVLKTAAKGIAEIITVSGYVNVDFEDVKTVMKDSGAAVMGSSTLAGEQRALRAAEAAISSPLLNNTNIHGAKKILLSITSGVAAELQMDELSDITDFIHEKAGDEAEVIFGHGVDAGLEESINVTVIATGFKENGQTGSVNDEKTVYDLEKSQQINIFESREANPSRPSEPIVYTVPDESLETNGYEFEKPEERDTEPETDKEVAESDVVFTLDGDFKLPEKKDEPDGSTKVPSEEIENDNRIEEKKEALQRQAKERSEKLQGIKGDNTKDEDYKEVFDVPAYMRRKIKLQDTPHSSEQGISKYNLTDDNQILGNNK